MFQQGGDDEGLVLMSGEEWSAFLLDMYGYSQEEFERLHQEAKEMILRQFHTLRSEG